MKIVCLLLPALCALALAVRAADTVPLVIDLPAPLFVGTPRPIQLPRLEPPRSGKRPALMVAAGTTLLSRGKPVTASDTSPVVGELAFVTDGDKTGIEGSYVEFGPGAQWVQIDLGAPRRLAAIAVWHFHSQPRVYHGVVVQTSDDSSFKAGVATLFNNDADNVSGRGAGKDLEYVETYEGKLIDARGSLARYVRLYSNGSTSDELNDYVEVEIFGAAK